MGDLRGKSRKEVSETKLLVNPCVVALVSVVDRAFSKVLLIGLGNSLDE